MKVIDTADPLLLEMPVEYDDPDELLDAVIEDYPNRQDAQSYFPTEYVVYYTGPRGSSKTTQLVRHALRGLALGIPVFTNIDLYPEKIGIKNRPNPVDLEFLLCFDEGLQDAIIVISEIDTWFDRMRETSTGNRLAAKFFQQLRKKGLRVFIDTQDYLPGTLMRQVDKLVYCHDFFFTQWGRERNLPKGTTFYYDCWDYSGIFTGWRGFHWREVLYHAERIWPLFNTYQIYDPLQFARKIKVIGGDMEYDQDTKQLYPVGQRKEILREIRQREEQLFSTEVFEKAEQTGFLDALRQYPNAIDAYPRGDPVSSLIAISCKAMRAILNRDDQWKQLYVYLYDHACREDGCRLGRIRGQEYVILRRPPELEERNE
jgi:hypothetical protein